VLANQSTIALNQIDHPHSLDIFSLLTLIMLHTLISLSFLFKLMLDLELSLRRKVLLSEA